VDNGIFGSNPVNSFAVRPDLINAAPTVPQPAFNLGTAQSQSSSSTLFSIANHGASQPTGFGPSANAASGNPVFGFGGPSSVTADLSVFAAVTSSGAVAQNSFATPFGGANQNSQSTPSFGFQTPAVPSAFNFGELIIIRICRDLIICEFYCLTVMLVVKTVN